MNLLDNEEIEASSGRGKIIVAAFAALALGIGVFVYLSGQDDPEPAPEPAAEVAPAEVEAPPPPPKKKAAPRTSDLPSTGALRVTANVDGAQVYIEGDSAGATPYGDDEIGIGEYDVTVRKGGYQDFTERVRIRPGETLELRASLELVPPSLMVTSDVPGATVFIDRKYVGTTPLEVPNVVPGPHQVTVSADGYEMYAGSVEIDTGRHDLNVDFKSQVTEFNEFVVVVHKHSFGKCEGTLVADAAGIRYESDHKDAFVASYGSLERFEVDYIEKNMNLKLLKGKNYNFTEKSGDSDPLFVFHKNVSAYIDGL